MPALEPRAARGVGAMESAARLEARYRSGARWERGDRRRWIQRSVADPLHVRSTRPSRRRLASGDSAARAIAPVTRASSLVHPRLLCIRGSRLRPRRFLKPSLDDLLDPFALTDMTVAVDRILARDRQRRAHRHSRRLRRRRRHIDGHSATRARAAWRRRHPFHPRASAGWLWTAAGVARSPAAERVHLVISVDCGIRGVEAARTRARARARSDHHGSSRARHRAAAALAVINPKRHDCTLSRTRTSPASAWR